MPKGHTALDLLDSDLRRSASAKPSARSVSAGISVGSDEAAGLFWMGGGSSSGMVVTPETAMRAAAVYACVQAISSTIATVPLVIYKRLKAGGKQTASEHPLYSLLHDAPNDLLTSVEFREMSQTHLCLRGNAYSRVVRDGSGSVASIDPIHPDRVSVFRNGNVVTYSVQQPQGGQVVLTGDEMLHLRGLGPEGVVGYSPISLAREAVGLALATEKHGATLFGNGARPSGTLEVASALSKEQANTLRREWEAIHQGPDGSNRIAILSNGAKYAGVSMSNEDAQFLETRQYQLSDIARIFRVPPHKIGDLARSTNNNIEQQSLEFVTDCIRPWAVRWEQRMNRILLTPAERKTYFIELNLDGLMRGDTAARYNAYNLGVNGGWLNPNEVRDIENMNPIPGGDEYRQPMNMAKLGDFAEQKPAVTGKTSPGATGNPTNE